MLPVEPPKKRSIHVAQDNGKKPTFLTETASWIIARQISVYLAGREKPMTDLTVCYVGADVLVCRWNSSTHLIQRSQILAIRFAPDCDPCRDIKHPLHRTVQIPRQTPPRSHPLPDVEPSEADNTAGLKRLAEINAAIAARRHVKTTTTTEGDNRA
jgi:hypothetical protein